jgi:hypothetical protein
MLRIIHGKPPTKQLLEGLELKDMIWAIMERCWDLIPGKRPTPRGVEEALHKLLVAGRYSEMFLANKSSVKNSKQQYTLEHRPPEHQPIAESMHESLLMHEYIVRLPKRKPLYCSN